MAEIIDLKIWREVQIAANATALLHGLLVEAAEDHAAGKLFTAADRRGFASALARAFDLFGDTVGYCMSFSSGRADTFQSDEVLYKILCMTADEAAKRILSVEGRAILFNAAFLALDGKWRIDRCDAPEVVQFRARIRARLAATPKGAGRRARGRRAQPVTGKEKAGIGGRP